MLVKPDYIRKKYGPLQAKTLRNALARVIREQFPRIGGPRIRGLCADMIAEVLASHLRLREHVQHGQVVWMAVRVNARPRRHQRIADTPLVPVILELSTVADVEDRLKRAGRAERLGHKAVRLCQQAHEQGGLLSNCDLAELLNRSDAEIAHVLTDHEKQTGQLVPRRATLHDVGTGLTHKRIICWKRYAEGKTADVVARETYHDLESVDRYLGQFDRVRHCRQEGLTPEQTAYTLNCSVRLVKEYLAIDEELGKRGS